MLKITLILLLVTQVKSLYVTVPTGSVVVWYIWQVLQEFMGIPGGVHFYNPITSSYEIIDVTSQKDTIGPIECISSDKQKVTFPSVQVWNQLPAEHVYKVLKVFQKRNQGIPYDKPLIFDPVNNYIKETCSEYTGEQLRSDDYKSLNEKVKNHLEQVQKNRPELNGNSTGINILRVFVEIPKLAHDVEKNYQEIAVQKTATQAEAYRQETELKKKETSNKLEELEAQKKLSVAETENKQSIEKNEAKAKMAKITAESEADQKRINADAESYANHKKTEDKSYENHKKAEDNKNLLTDAYLKKMQLEYFGCQNVIHYGDLPNFLPNPVTVQKNTD